MKPIKKTFQETLMKKNIRKTFTALFLAIISVTLIGCGGDINLKIYARDLQDIMNQKETVLYTTANIQVKGMNEKDIEFLKTQLTGFSNEKIVEYNYSDALSFDIKIPITKSGTDVLNKGDLLVIEGKQDDRNYDFYINFNNDLLQTIDDYFFNEHWIHFNISEFKIKLTITNDIRQSTKIKAYSSYINGTAYPFAYSGNLNERDELVMELSEIFNKYLSKNENAGQHPIFTIEN